jgi:hypothetical protein
MDIGSGIAALKAGFDISATIAQRIKEGKLSASEISDLLLKLREALLDSQAALIQAAEENRVLKEELANNNRITEVEKDLQYRNDGGFYVRASEVADGREIPYCPLCWGNERKLVPLNPGDGSGYYYCSIHKAPYETARYRDSQRV